jgi:hypothetical protein
MEGRGERDEWFSRGGTVGGADSTDARPVARARPKFFSARSIAFGKEIADASAMMCGGRCRAHFSERHVPPDWVITAPFQFYWPSLVPACERECEPHHSSRDRGSPGRFGDFVVALAAKLDQAEAVAEWIGKPDNLAPNLGADPGLGMRACSQSAASAASRSSTTTSR